MVPERRRGEVDENDKDKKSPDIKPLSGGLGYEKDVVKTDEPVKTYKLVAYFPEILQRIVEEKPEKPELLATDVEKLVKELFAKGQTVIEFNEAEMNLSLHLLTQGKTFENAQTPTEAVGYKIEARLLNDPEYVAAYSREVFFSEFEKSEKNGWKSTDWHDPLRLGEVPQDHQQILKRFGNNFVGELIQKELATRKPTIH